jgi:general secretion pathway protein G
MTQPSTITARFFSARRQLAVSHNKGMSLVEVLIVLTIMASIAGVVGVYALGALVDSQKKEARIEAGSLSSMVEQHMMLKGSAVKLPETLEELSDGHPPVTKRVPKDPWGNDYIYHKMSGQEFEVFSAGPDGLEGTEDDVHQEG